MGRRVGNTFESMTILRISDHRNKMTNMINAVVLWMIWKLRNDLHFHGHAVVKYAGVLAVAWADAKKMTSDMPGLRIAEDGAIYFELGEVRVRESEDHMVQKKRKINVKLKPVREEASYVWEFSG